MVLKTSYDNIKEAVRYGLNICISRVKITSVYLEESLNGIKVLSLENSLTMTVLTN
ncbi:MAG: hypothetical protein JW891_13340 [Candidatus Lokiarchaeota archaeon]|nr:hypothetical protein [Candidatus Lokiarchaeota archaeon]